MELQSPQQRDTPLFDEKFRPQLHFTPERNWMNDPNGLLFYKGKYHLFYQHNPEGNLWGNMSWGHATSTDLMKWEHLPVAILHDEKYGIFSGSAVVDYTNSAGFGSLDNPAMVAIYTAHNHDGSHQSQHLAFSLDEGITWTKYEGNPVLDLNMKDFRDPKVTWEAATNTWLMTIAKPLEYKISFFRSADLKSWKHLSDFGPTGNVGGCWECPDLFPLTTTAGSTHWVLLVSINPGGPTGGSGTQYFIGDWDGTTFVEKQEAQWIDYGRDNYAGVTFGNVANNRKVFLGWMNNWAYSAEIPTTIWRGSMTAPRELQLLEVNKKLTLTSNPIVEFTSENDYSFEMRSSESSEIRISVGDHSVVITYNNKEKFIEIDRSNGWFVGVVDTPQVSPKIDHDKFTIRILLDEGSLELFVPEAGLAMTSLTSLPTAGVTLQKTAKRLP